MLAVPYSPSIVMRLQTQQLGCHPPLGLIIHSRAAVSTAVPEVEYTGMALASFQTIAQTVEQEWPFGLVLAVPVTAGMEAEAILVVAVATLEVEVS